MGVEGKEIEKLVGWIVGVCRRYPIIVLDPFLSQLLAGTIPDGGWRKEHIFDVLQNLDRYVINYLARRGREFFERLRKKDPEYFDNVYGEKVMEDKILAAILGLYEGMVILKGLGLRIDKNTELHITIQAQSILDRIIDEVMSDEWRENYIT